jgi:hypothetical protein
MSITRLARFESKKFINVEKYKFEVSNNRTGATNKLSQRLMQREL